MDPSTLPRYYLSVSGKHLTSRLYNCVVDGAWTCDQSEHSFDNAYELLHHMITSAECSSLSEKQRRKRPKDLDLGHILTILAAVDFARYKDDIEAYVAAWEKGELPTISLGPPLNVESSDNQLSGGRSKNTKSEGTQLEGSESKVPSHGFPVKAPTTLSTKDERTYNNCMERLNAIDRVIEFHRGERVNLSAGGKNAALEQWNKENEAKGRGWGPYKSYESLTKRRACDIETLKDYLKQAGYVIGNTAGGGTASGNTGGDDQYQGTDKDHEAVEDQNTVKDQDTIKQGSNGASAQDHETADEYQDMDLDTDGDDTEDMEM